MSRELTAARARVAESARAEYLAVLGSLRGRLALRGRQLWLFERRGQRGEFLEFREGAASGISDPAVITRAADELSLTERLSRLAVYDDGSEDPWDEVPLPEPTEG
jgi:hypothetical protein